jgi:hypothetical protein
VAQVAPFSKGVTEAAARGWDPISANSDARVGGHRPKYVEGCERAGRKADPANWRVAKAFLWPTTTRSRRPTTDPKSPYRYH